MERGQNPSPPKEQNVNEDRGEPSLDLTLSIGSSSQNSHPIPSQPSSHILTHQNPNQTLTHQNPNPYGGARPRARTQASRLRRGKSETIPPAYPWSTDKRASVHTLQYLLTNGLRIITGQAQCRRCEQTYDISYDLQGKFEEVAGYICQNKDAMHDRAPQIWMNPTLPNCGACNQSNCVKPVLYKKRSINWLFLLLGQMLGCCKLSELKYFCKHTNNHRTGAKDRVLYLTYLGLCKQLHPTGPFDV